MLNLIYFKLEGLHPSYFNYPSDLEYLSAFCKEYEPGHEKTLFLHMRKQRHRSAAW